MTKTNVQGRLQNFFSFSVYLMDQLEIPVILAGRLKMSLGT